MKEAAEYREKNPEKIKESLKKSREKNGAKHERQKRLRELFVPEVLQKKKEDNKKWTAENSDHITICRHAYCEENKEAIKERNKAWRKNNPEKVRAARWARKARQRSAQGRLLDIDIQAKLNEQNGRCHWCSAELVAYHLDHFLPLSKGGSHSADNIVISCPTCNTSKGAKLPEDFLKHLTFVKENSELIQEKREYFRKATQKRRAKKKASTETDA